MKVSYTKAYTTYTSLGDEADRTALAILIEPSFQQLVNVEPGFRAASQFVHGNKNAVSTLTLVISSPYASEAAALASVVTMRAILADPLHLKVEEGATVHYYPNAANASYQPKFNGRTVTHIMQFASADVTTTAPTANPT